MVRCEEFYEKWRTHPNFCDKNRLSVRLIDFYLKVVDELNERGISPDVTYVTLSENAARPLITVKDPEVRNVVLANVAGMINRRGKPSAADIKAWIAAAEGKEPVPQAQSQTQPAHELPSGWHPSVSYCNGCARLGYEKDPKSNKKVYICTAAKPEDGFVHGRPPYGMEECPLGTGPVKVGCRYFGEDTLCHAKPDQICTQQETRDSYNCPIRPGSELSPALDLMRRQAYRNPQTGNLTTAYCQNRWCKHLKKREMNNNYECELSGKIPGNMRDCPLEGYAKKYPDTAKCLDLDCEHLKFIRRGIQDDKALHVCTLTGMRPDNMCGKFPDGCPLKPDEPAKEPEGPTPYTSSKVDGDIFKPSEERESGVVTRAINLLSDKPEIETFTVKAGRHTGAVIRQMIKYGEANDELEAAQFIFDDGEALWLDKMEQFVQAEAEGMIDDE